MATIDELLNGSTPLDDVDEVLSIDPVGRRIIVPSDELILGVVDDVNSECKYFKMPRRVGNIADVTEYDLRVIYNTGEDGDGYFPVVQCVSDDTSVVFCWEVSPNVTSVAGDVEFSIAVCRSAGGVMEKAWQTTPTVGKVLRGLKAPNTEEALGKPDALAMIEDALKRAEDAAARAENAAGISNGGGTVDIVDSVTGKHYALSVSNGKLTMTESEVTE